MRIYHVGLEGKKHCVHICLIFYFRLRIFIASLENPSFYLKLVKTIQSQQKLKNRFVYKQTKVLQIIFQLD